MQRTQSKSHQTLPAQALSVRSALSGARPELERCQGTPREAWRHREVSGVPGRPVVLEAGTRSAQRRSCSLPTVSRADTWGPVCGPPAPALLPAAATSQSLGDETGTNESPALPRRPRTNSPAFTEPFLTSSENGSLAPEPQ